MTQVNTPTPIIVALDYPAVASAMVIVDKLDPKRCALKVGKELFVRGGPVLVGTLVDRGYRVFLDLKFHDIPNTVAGACDAAADLGVWMMNLHASGGQEMMEKARDRLDKRSGPRPLLIAVTVLTSLDGPAMEQVGLAPYPKVQVLRLAHLAQESGLDGVVCSPLETSQVRQELGDKFRIVTPGVRSAGVEANDQKRVMTPVRALTAGANHLVIGREITAAADPMVALERIEKDIVESGYWC